MPLPRTTERTDDEFGSGKYSYISTIKDERWTCNVCGTLDNWASRSRCRNCKAYGPKGSGGGGKGGGGQGPGWKGAGKGKGIRTAGVASTGSVARSWGIGTGGDSTTFAQRQLQRQHEEQKIQRIRDESRRKEEALRAANVKLQRELAAAKGGVQKQGDGDDDMEDEEESDEARQEKIDATQKAIPYLILQFGEGSPPVEKARSEVEELLRAAREAKPYKTHRGQLERRLDRLRKQQAKAKEEEDELLQEVEATQARLNSLRAAMEERERNIASTDDELKDLLRRAIAEGESADTPPAMDPATAWSTINNTLADMVAQPGVPPAWAAQLGGLLEQVRIAAVAIQQQAGTNSSAVPPPLSSSPSVAPSSTTITSKSPSPKASSKASSKPPPSAATPRPAEGAPVAGHDGAAASAGSSAWEARALELAFAEGGDSGGGGKSTDELRQGDRPTVQAPAGSEQTSTQMGNAVGPQPTAANVPAPSHHENDDKSESDDGESEDEMESILGADELNKREDESAAQHRLRLAKHLKERAARKKEERVRERKHGKPKGDGKERQATRTKPVRKTK